MADDDTTTATEEGKEGKEAEGKEEDQRVPYERFQKANKQAKEAKDQAAQLQKTVDDLKSQVEQSKQEGLPELDKLKQQAEKAEKRAEEAEKKADEKEREALNTRRERWVSAAAAEQNFHDPDDASRFVTLDDIESSDDAKAAVKRVAKEKQHLVKAEEKKLPGQVLKDGQRPKDGERKSAIDTDQDAETVSEGLKEFLKDRGSVLLDRD